MAIRITHSKVNQIADWTQAKLDEYINAGLYPYGTLISEITQPSDWNDDHSSTDLDYLEDSVRTAAIVDMNSADYTMTAAESAAAIKVILNSGDGTKTLSVAAADVDLVPSETIFFTAFTTNGFDYDVNGTVVTVRTENDYDVVFGANYTLATTYVPYTGAYQNVNLGTYNLATTGRLTSGGAYSAMTVNGSTVNSQLAVNSDSQAVLETHTYSATAGNGAVIYGARSRGTNASPSVVQSGDTIMSFAAVGYDGTDYALGGRVDFIVDGTPGSNDMPTKALVSLSRDGTQSPVDVLQIQSTGLMTGYNNAGANAGIVSVEHFCRLSADYTLTSTGSAQKMFNASTNGALTLGTGLYFFECLFSVDTMSATSGNAAWGILGAGTATIGAAGWCSAGRDAAALDTANTVSGGYFAVSDTANVIVTSAVNTSMWASISGYFTVTAAGTIIPSITLSTAAAAVVKSGSFFKCHRVGTESTTYVGAWS